MWLNILCVFIQDRLKLLCTMMLFPQLTLRNATELCWRMNKMQTHYENATVINFLLFTKCTKMKHEQGNGTTKRSNWLLVTGVLISDDTHNAQISIAWCHVVIYHTIIQTTVLVLFLMPHHPLPLITVHEMHTSYIARSSGHLYYNRKWLIESLQVSIYI